MTKWKLVPVEQFYELMFRLDELEGNGALPYRLEGMAAAIEAAPPPPKLSDERIKELSDIHMNMYGFDDVAFARAIEREILGGEA